MEKVMNYIIGGIIALLVLFSLAPTIFSQYNVLGQPITGETGDTYFDIVPAGVEATVGAVITIFFVLTLWRMYQSATE